MAAASVNYDVATGNCTVTTTAGPVYDLTGIIQLPITLAYLRTDNTTVVRLGLATAQFVVGLPGGQSLTFDPRTATALDRLGWTVPRV